MKDSQIMSFKTPQEFVKRILVVKNYLMLELTLMKLVHVIIVD